MPPMPNVRLSVITIMIGRHDVTTSKLKLSDLQLNDRGSTSCRDVVHTLEPYLLVKFKRCNLVPA